MKKWQKTIFTWNIDTLTTNVPTEEKPRSFLILTQMRIISEPDGKHRVDLRILRPYAPSTPRKEEAAVRQRLASIGTNGRLISLLHMADCSYFVLLFSNKEKEDFCTSALSVAQDIFRVLGITDAKNKNIADFSLSQETLVMFKKTSDPLSPASSLSNKWITFADYLRFKRGWPRKGKF